MDDRDAPELWQSMSTLSSGGNQKLAVAAGSQPSSCNIQQMDTELAA